MIITPFLLATIPSNSTGTSGSRTANSSQSLVDVSWSKPPPMRPSRLETLRQPGALIGPCILLLLAERPDHGLRPGDRLEEFEFAEASTASLYRELRGLEDAGLAHSYWEASQSRGPAVGCMSSPPLAGERSASQPRPSARSVTELANASLLGARGVGQRCRALGGSGPVPAVIRHGDPPVRSKRRSG